MTRNNSNFSSNEASLEDVESGKFSLYIKPEIPKKRRVHHIQMATVRTELQTLTDIRFRKPKSGWSTADWNTKFIALWKNSYMSDVTFIVKHRRFPAHKFVLGIESEVFCAMFYGPMAEKNEIRIEDCKEPEDFSEFLSLIYRKRANVTWENIRQLSYLRKKYMIAVDPKIFCDLLKSVDTYNSLEVLNICVKMEEEDMVVECIKKIIPDISRLVDTKEFLDLDQPSLKAILQQDILNIKEIDLFNAVDRWCFYQVELKRAKSKVTTKRAVLGDALYHIRFPLLKMEDFSNVCMTSTLLADEEYRELSRFICGKTEDRSNVGEAHVGGFPNKLRIYSHINVLLRRDNAPFQDEYLPSSHITFNTNTDVWLKGIKSDVQVDNVIAIDSTSRDVVCHRRENMDHYLVLAKKPFRIKAGEDYRLYCDVRRTRYRRAIRYSCTWGDFEFKAHGEPGCLPTVRGLIFSLTDKEAIDANRIVQINDIKCIEIRRKFFTRNRRRGFLSYLLSLFSCTRH